jgi:hypothetical protein
VNRREWTNKEIKILKDNHGKMTHREIGKLLNRTRGSVQSKSLKLGLKNNNNMSKIYKYNKDFFTHINDENSAYWLGFLYADGNISEGNRRKRLNVRLSKKDIGHLYKFTNDLNSNIPINEYKSKIKNKEYDACSITLNSTKICNDLISHGIVPNKTYMDDFPYIKDDYLFIHFLRGVWDGDGCIYYEDYFKNRNFRVSLELTSNNSKFLKHIKKRLADFNINSNIYKHGENECLKIFNLEDCKKMCNLIYKNSKVYLERKYKKQKEIINA